MKKLFVCTNYRPHAGQPSCVGGGSKDLFEFACQEVLRRGIAIDVQHSVCMGYCDIGPNIKPAAEDFIHGVDVTKLVLWLDAFEANQP